MTVGRVAIKVARQVGVKVGGKYQKGFKKEKKLV